MISISIHAILITLSCISTAASTSQADANETAWMYGQSQEATLSEGVQLNSLHNLSALAWLHRVQKNNMVNENIWFSQAVAAGAHPGAHQPRPRLLYCYIPKNACSTFKLLLLRLAVPEHTWRAWLHRHGARAHKAVHSRDVFGLTGLIERMRRNDLPDEDYNALQVQGAVPGFVVTRNPYVRLLSGYLDKVVHAPQARPNSVKALWIKRTYGFRPNEHPTFKEWVWRLHKIWSVFRQNPVRRMNTHFAPQTAFCGMQQGVQFRYQVKLEALPTAYPFLVHKLGLGPWVDTGWSKVYGGTRECFYKPTPETPCDWWRNVVGGQAAKEHRQQKRRRRMVGVAAGHNATDGSSGDGGGDGVDDKDDVDVDDGDVSFKAPLPPAMPEPPMDTMVPHKTNAAARLHEFYDEETARLATEVYADDFAAFGYQKWEGPPAPYFSG